MSICLRHNTTPILTAFWFFNIHQAQSGRQKRPVLLPAPVSRQARSSSDREFAILLRVQLEYPACYAHPDIFRKL